MISSTEEYFSSPEFEAALMNDDGQAAREHLAAGYAIYYGDDNYPEGLIKKFPDGRKQLVTVGAHGEISVIRDL